MQWRNTSTRLSSNCWRSSPIFDAIGSATVAQDLAAYCPDLQSFGEAYSGELAHIAHTWTLDAHAFSILLEDCSNHGDLCDASYHRHKPPH